MSSRFFNPQAFFEKTTHYASQARGLFQLTRLPNCLPIVTGNAFLDSGKLTQAKNLLTSGIVASGFSLPSFSLNTFDPFSYTGPTKKIAYGQMFNDIDVTFQLMGTTLEEARSLYYFFSKWHEAIAGPVHTQRSGSLSGDNPELTDIQYNVISDNTMFSVQYYDNYITDGLLTVYSPNNYNPLATGARAVAPRKVVQIFLTELYPITILQSALSWESQDAPLQLSVSFTFHYASVANIPNTN